MSAQCLGCWEALYGFPWMGREEGKSLVLRLPLHNKAWKDFIRLRDSRPH